ncbi:NADP-dependent oxidoreductase domain-containing protein [Hysterangium stoloniferum]|nr:NADP-dependent oxidoreductase domain-containing protein [Hysterangium stoloniferum]
MPWTNIKLNTSATIPNIAFGTWHAGNGDEGVKQLDQAFSVGFEHIDTAQNYGNEKEAGQAIKESGLPRDKLFITTKFSGRTDVDTAIKNSLANLGLTYVDLYLIHGPDESIDHGDIPKLWRKFEEFFEKGFAKSIGVSNYDVGLLELVLREGKIKPAANQIELHPYVWKEQQPTVDFCKKHSIVVEAYSPLLPITKYSGGPVDKVLGKIHGRSGAASEQILLAWAKAKGAVVVTASSKLERLKGYVEAGNLVLTDQEIQELETAGAGGPPNGKGR